MEHVFIPYQGDHPAAVFVNGHRVIILAHSEDSFEPDLELIGADHLRCIELGDSAEEATSTLTELAEQVKGGVVVAPANVNLPEVLRSLELELPWLH
ncbi:MAG: hypothetical protein KDD42_02760 [Bdellovibrionales bacterium]|nr:hypothetical protein [Bdellovibrionales bacterium]